MTCASAPEPEGARHGVTDTLECHIMMGFTEYTWVVTGLSGWGPVSGQPQYEMGMLKPI